MLLSKMRFRHMTPIQARMLTFLCLFLPHIALVVTSYCSLDNSYSTLRPTATATIPLTPDGLRSLGNCSKQCLADPCCIAFGLKDGQCETATVKAHDLDFIREGSCTGDCRDAEQCTAGACRFEHGVDGGTAFTFFPQFSSSRDVITNITLTSTLYSDVEVLSGIGVSFGTGSQHFFGEQSLNPYECILAPGEYIIEASMYEHMLFGAFPVQSGLKFVTSSKVCGPYGSSVGTERTYRGSRLIYMYGRVGMAFDKVAFVFDRCNR